MSSRPSIVIVPGSFSSASMYYDLVKRLQNEGYEVYVNNLPSTSRNPPERPASLNDDALFVRGIIESVVDQGKDVLVVTHSYGGVVGTEAAKGVSKAERQADGKLGGITRIAYLTSIVPPEGGSLVGEQGEAPPEIVETDEYGFLTIVGVELGATGTFPDLDFDKAVDLMKSMTKHSALSFTGQLTYAAYKHIPVSYIRCEKDFIVAPEKQQKFIDHIRTESGKEVDVHTLPTGHCPNVTAPEELAKAIVRIAGTS